MERELSILVEAQRLLRLACNNLGHKGLEIQKLRHIQKDLNEFVRDFQYSEEYQSNKED